LTSAVSPAAALRGIQSGESAIATIKFFDVVSIAS